MSMRFTEKKTEDINNYYKAIEKHGFLPLEVYSDKICTNGMCICDLQDIATMIKSLEMLKDIIETRTDVLM